MALAMFLLPVAPRPAFAATPAAGTIDGTVPVAWDFGPVGGASGTTDSYNLTVQLPQPAASLYAPDLRTGSSHAAVLTVRMTWTGNDPSQSLNLSATDPANNSVGNSTLALTNDGSDVNILMIQNPRAVTYTITASNVNGNSPAALTPHAVAHLQVYDLAGTPRPAQPAGAVRYDNYHIPLSLMPPAPEETQVLGGRSFGEPSIGVDPRNDKVMYQAGLFTIRASFNDATSPATVSWANVSDSPLTDSLSLDAILAVDRGTGRTFVSQLTGACSISAVSDDDGASWTPAPKPCQTPAGADHQTIGAGPYAAPLPQGVLYPNAVYYCSQNVAEAECALSVDGGLNYGTAVPMWTLNDCFGIHGHVKVAPNDGTVYVPDKACGSRECLITTSTAGPNCHPGFAVSTDNGTTWTLHTLAESYTRLFNSGDPSIGIGAGGTMYMGFGDRDGHPKVAVCTNQGANCASPIDVGAAFHIESTQMAEVVAGDDNRAAFAFLGSTMPGDDQSPDFTGTWHLYVAITTDGGHSWTTTDATPDQPVQRGCIEFAASCPNSRGSNDQRNLLDFNDLTIDREGRVLVAYTDGCQPEVATPPKHGTCLTDATRLSGLATEIQGPAIARQSCGPGLYARFDAVMPVCPGSVTTAVTNPLPAVSGGGQLPPTPRGGLSPSVWAFLGALGTLALGLGAGARRRRS